MGNPISELQGVTCQCHYVTCHTTQANTPRLNPAISRAGIRFTYPGGMEGWVDL